MFMNFMVLYSNSLNTSNKSENLKVSTGYEPKCSQNTDLSGNYCHCLVSLVDN